MTGGKKTKHVIPAMRVRKPALEEDAVIDQPLKAAPVETAAGGRSAASLMPVSADVMAILEHRAAVLAVENVDDEDTAVFDDYVQFRLGQSVAYGIPSARLDEVMVAERIAPLPCTPAFIVGVMNHQGRLLAILDLQMFLGLDRDAGAEASENRIIVVHDAELQLGLLVSAVECSGRYCKDRLEQPLPAGNGAGSDYIAGIWNGTIAMLDVGALLSAPTLAINETVMRAAITPLRQYR